MPALAAPVSPAARAAMLRTLAATVRNQPFAREAIAEAFELVADCMEPCTDCGNPQGQDDAPAKLVAAQPLRLVAAELVDPGEF